MYLLPFSWLLDSLTSYIHIPQQWIADCEEDLTRILDSLIEYNLDKSSSPLGDDVEAKKQESFSLLNQLRREGSQYIDGMEKIIAKGWNVLDEMIHQSKEEMYAKLEKNGGTRDLGKSVSMPVPVFC